MNPRYNNGEVTPLGQGIRITLKQGIEKSIRELLLDVGAIMDTKDQPRGITLLLAVEEKVRA